MNEAIALLIAILIGLALLAGFFATIGLLFPKPVTGAQLIIAAVPGRALVIGLVNLLFFGVLALGSFALGEQTGMPVLALPGLLITGLLVMALCWGLTAVVEYAGERFAPVATSLRRTVTGAVVVSLGCALPFVGWFLLLPYVGLLGLGAQIIWLLAAYRDWAARRKDRGRVGAEAQSKE